MAGYEVIKFSSLGDGQVGGWEKDKCVLSYIEQGDPFILCKLQNCVPKEPTFANPRDCRDNSIIIDVDRAGSVRSRGRKDLLKAFANSVSTPGWKVDREP